MEVTLSEVLDLFYEIINFLFSEGKHFSRSLGLSPPHCQV